MILNNGIEDDIKTESLLSMTNNMKDDAQQGSYLVREENFAPSLTFEKFPSYNEYVKLTKTDKEKIWRRVRVLVEVFQQRGIDPFSL